MKSPRSFVAAICVAALAFSGCGKEEGGEKAAATAKKAAEKKVPPYTYPAPVKGHVKEINIGEFDLVDGIAYPAAGGTVVFVTAKPIASPVLVDSACPMIQARALAELRSAGFSEITLDASGRSNYFFASASSGTSLADLSGGGRAWSSTLKADAGRASGVVHHRRYGWYEFDLPLSNPKVDQLSYGDREQKRHLPATTPKPPDQTVTATYVALRDAAIKKNLKAMLAALGFNAKQSTAIQGLDGIDADFAVFADRFLTPGTPEDPSTRPGTGQIRGMGIKQSAGKKYWNDYYFDLCGDKLVLTGIVEQTQ